MDDRLGEYKHKGGRSGGGRCEVSKDGCLYVNKRNRVSQVGGDYGLQEYTDD
jgi:hypothetical protein